MLSFRGSGSVRVSVYSPAGRVVSVVEEGFPRSVAYLKVSPRRGRTPVIFTVQITTYRHAGAGMRPRSLVVVGDCGVVGKESMLLAVLPEDLTPESHSNQRDL